MQYFVRALTTVSCLTILVGTVKAEERWDRYYPEELAPFTGNYVGRWSEEEKVNPDIAAQVIPLGGDDYRIRLVTKLDMRCPPIAEVEVSAQDGKLSFETDRYYGTLEGESFTGGRDNGKATFEMKKAVRLSPTLGLEAPEDAIVLFDGSDFDAWNGTKGWKLTGDGAMIATPDGGYLTSKQTFKDLRMHVEFRTPYQPRGRGQYRGNSGVFIQDVYEVQVLDSFGLEGYYNDCGALYKVAAPMVNATAPPTQWQTYDIEYRAPRYDDSGELREYPKITVRHNGVLIHNEQELPWITAWTEAERKQDPPKNAGPIKLQTHTAYYVQFRNIWVEDLGESVEFD